MLSRQGVHPRRQENVQLPHGELVQHRLQDLPYIFLLQPQAVHRHALHLIPAGDVPGQGQSPVRFGVLAVQQDDKRLSQLLQFPDHPLLRFQIILSGNVGNAAVCGDDDANGGMLRDDLPGADLRRLRHGDRMIVPRRCDHPGLIILRLAQGPPDHVAHTVDKPDGKGRAPLQLDLGRLLRHELRFRRHHRAAGAALGQLISGPLPAVHIVNIGNDLCLHEPLDKGGFPCPHRPYHTDIDVARSAGGNILIDRGIHSIPSFFRFYSPFL